MYGMGGYSGGNSGYSGASAGTSGYSAYSGSHVHSNTQEYFGNSNASNNHPQPKTPHFSLAENFLTENRPWTPMISNMGEVKEVVEQTFEKITGQEFPQDSIKILVCDEEQFRNIHTCTGGAWNPGIMGFSFNKYGKGASEIYVRQDHMDSLLLTIGHEIGHVLSPTLINAQDEEAKAHAFSLAWMETIREHNIAGLSSNITPNPAHNGLHDVAFDFVKYLLSTGTSSFDIFKTLAHGLTSIIATTR